jgi:copper chaperone CopZ
MGERMLHKTIHVDGMSCDHCIHAVTEEISEIPGVTGVSIDLYAGEISPVTIASDNEISDTDIAAAVDQAGYTISPS